MYKDKPLIINILLCIWQLPQVMLGIIMLLVFRNKTEYTNSYNGITVWNICSGDTFGRACFSTGPFIITCKGADEEILKHETGHSLSSIRTGLFYHIVISLPSVCLFWYRRIAKKDMDFYYDHFPENLAEKHGMTDRYKAKIGLNQVAMESKKILHKE